MTMLDGIQVLLFCGILLFILLRTSNSRVRRYVIELIAIYAVYYVSERLINSSVLIGGAMLLSSIVLLYLWLNYRSFTVIKNAANMIRPGQYVENDESDITPLWPRWFTVALLIFLISPFVYFLVLYHMTMNLR